MDAWLIKKTQLKTRQQMLARLLREQEASMRMDVKPSLPTITIESPKIAQTERSWAQVPGDEPPTKKRESEARPYKDCFLKYGFVNCSNPNQEARPMCVICSEKLANESLKPTKLKRHLDTLHLETANKPLDFFQRKAQEIKSSADVLHRNVTLNDKAQLASYMVSYRVATEKQSHTIAEKIILPAAMDMVSTVIDEKLAEKLKCIPLSDNTISRQINDISNNLEEQLILRLKAAGDFSIQLDESTDVSDCATLLVYVRYMWENEFAEDLLCCLPIPTGTTGQQIFSVLEQLRGYKVWVGLAPL